MISDAEHPTVIPMDLPLPQQEPRGPMTRARARALENEVTYFLSDITYDPIETWLLPKSETLCMIRYQEDPPKDAREGVQAPKFMDEENPQKESRTPPRTQTSGHDPGRPAPGASSIIKLHNRQASTGLGHPAPTARTSGRS